ncbi:MAG: hypothetical protein HQM10_03240 [Candidatus Riflebacteria bacterium]|nr:hypothetical protein [Candidatus Riflebacteria bacterium]
MSINQFYRSIAVIILIFMSYIAEAIDLKLDLIPGQVFKYQITSECRREMYFNENTLKSVATATDNINVTVVAKKDGVYLLDIKGSNFRTRRLTSQTMKPVHDFCLDKEQQPFFLYFPEASWKKNETKKIEKEIEIFGEKVLLIWELSLVQYDEKTDDFTMGIRANVVLPQEKASKRKIQVKGTMRYDGKKGTFTSGDWTIDYGLAFNNKEIAIIRTLWKFRETIKTSFQLVEVNN